MRTNCFTTKSTKKRDFREDVSNIDHLRISKQINICRRTNRFVSFAEIRDDGGANSKEKMTLAEKGA